MKTNEINPSDNNEIRDNSSKGLEIKTTSDDKFNDGKEPNKFEEIEKEKLSKDSEVETKWENNNEQFRHFENTSNQEPYNKTEGFREEANSYAEKLREDREEQKIKLNELREEQERLKKQLDEMAEERNLSASNYMNNREFCKVLDDHTTVSEDIKETQMALKVTEANIERAEELSGKERIEEEEAQKENKGNLEVTEREEASNSEAGEEQRYKNKFEEVEKDNLSKDSEVETKWENNNEQFRHFENTSNQEPYNKTEGFREEANSYAEKLREDREEQKTKLNELREEQERLKKQLDEMAEERNLSASNYMNDKEFCKVLDDHTAVSEDIKETEMASKVTEANIERAEGLGGKERIEEEEAQEENKENIETTKGEADSNSEAVKEKNKFEEIEKKSLSKDSEVETKWENNNEQFRHFENTFNREPYNKTEEFREKANSYAEKLREDREEQKIKLNELREEQERLKKQLDEIAERRNFSVSNYMSDKEFHEVSNDYTAVSEEIKEIQMASKLTESNIERAEELSEVERDLEKSLKLFDQERWNELSFEERTEAIDSLINSVAKDLKLENKPDVKYYCSDKLGDYGGYAASENIIYINKSNLEDATEVVDTIAHESRHCWQYEMAEKYPNSPDGKRFAENFKEYIKPQDDYIAYRNQPVEVDAREYASKIIYNSSKEVESVSDEKSVNTSPKVNTYKIENVEKGALFDSRPKDLYLKEVSRSEGKVPVSDAVMKSLENSGLSLEKIKEIRDLPKPNKPDPKEYLNPEYYQKHLEPFEKTGCYRIQRTDPMLPDDQYGGILGHTSGLFVTSGEDMIKALEKANGDVTELEKIFGMNEGDWGKNPIIIRINEPKNLRIPDGNEMGAWIKYYIPGGFTSGNQAEAVIDSVPRGKYQVMKFNNPTLMDWMKKGIGE